MLLNDQDKYIMGLRGGIHARRDGLSLGESRGAEHSVRGLGIDQLPAMSHPDSEVVVHSNLGSDESPTAEPKNSAATQTIGVEPPIRVKEVSGRTIPGESGACRNCGLQSLRRTFKSS